MSDASAPPRVLLVDDVPEITSALARMIDAGHLRARVVRATRAEDAMDALERAAFAVVVSDYRMPGRTGLDVLCRARELQPEAHRILMSAYAELPESPERVREAGIDAILPKPFDMGEAVLLMSDFLLGRDAAIRAHRESVRAVIDEAS